MKEKKKKYGWWYPWSELLSPCLDEEESRMKIHWFEKKEKEKMFVLKSKAILKNVISVKAKFEKQIMKGNGQKIYEDKNVIKCKKIVIKCQLFIML